MSAPMPPDLPKKGDRIAGKYLVEEILGTGGMGVVVAARHMALRQRVAVKFLLPAALRLPEARERFLREAQAAVAIQSEHVARVVDVGTLESGSPYMVMEYLAGTDFSRLLKQRGALPVAEAVDYVLQAGEAIAEAHMLGIIHRDLKPANLFLTSRAEGSPLVKVLVFGLSKMTLADEDISESLTATSAILGSPHYMSPEQIRSLKHVGTGTDIWALGVILHEMLTGRRPFEGRTLTAISASIVADTPPPLRSLRPDVPEELDPVVLGCLEKDLARRIPTVAELAARLAPFAPPRSAPELERIAKLVNVPRMSLPAFQVDAPLDAPFPPVEASLGRPEDALDDDAATRAITTATRTAWITESDVVSVVAEAPAAPAPPNVAAPALAPPIGVPGPVGPPLDLGAPAGGAEDWAQIRPPSNRVIPLAIAAGSAVVCLTAVIGWLVLRMAPVDAPVATSPTVTAALAADPAPTPAPEPVPQPATAEPRPEVPAIAPPTAIASALPAPSASAASPSATPPRATATAASRAGSSAPPAPTARPAAPPRRGGNPLDRSD